MELAKSPQGIVHSLKENYNEQQADEFPGEFHQERKSIEDEEHDDTTSETTVSRTKANCFPFAWLIVLFILNSMVPPSAGVKCSDPSDIRLRNTKTGGIDCMLCPECGQSQQYSIPCGSTVDIVPDLRCVDCPKGTFSEHFDKKPCKPCTTCTNKIYKRNCTKDHNAICGSCLPGYRHDPITFACNLITTKANPTTTTAASKVTRTTVTTKQATPKGVTEPPPTPAVIITDNTPQATITDPLPTTAKNHTLPFVIDLKIKTEQPSSTSRSASKRSGLPTNPLIIALVVITSVICVGLGAVGVGVGIYVRMNNNKANSSRRIDLSSAEMQPLDGKSTLLSEYMNDCKFLSQAKHWKICDKINAKSKQNFKALVCGLGIQPDTVYQFYSQGKGDFHLVLDTLISSKPELTLEGIAQECERQRFKDVAKLFREEDNKDENK